MPGPSCSKHRLHNELIKGRFVNHFSRFNIQYSDIFAEKNVSALLQKLLTFFQQKISAYLRITWCKF